MDAYVGEIMAFGGTYAPVNWTLCQGQTLSISQYQLLYALIGTTYGGDGASTFGVPNLAGNLPVGMGQGSGLSNRVLGQSFGVPMVTLAAANIPAHTHTLLADNSTQPGQPSPANGYLTATATSATAATSGYVAAAATPVAMAPQCLSSAGGAGAPMPLDNFMPTMGMTMIICLQGLYPTRP